MHSYVTLPFAVTKDVFYRIAGLRLPYSEEEAKKEEERWSDVPSWIGLGDLRIAIFMGFVGGLKIALLGLFLAYLVGSVYGVYVIAARIARRRREHAASQPGIGNVADADGGAAVEAENETGMEAVERTEEAKKIPVHEQENAVPFGPFLAAGLYLSLFFYEPIMKILFGVGHP